MVCISDILSFLDDEGIPYEFHGDRATSINGFSSLKNYKPGSFTWVKKQENIPKGFDLAQISLAIVSNGITGPFMNVIETQESKRAFFSTIEHFYGEDEQRPAIGQFTYISPKVKLGKNVRIGHNCTLDGDITIGDNTVIWNGVTIINHVVIGCNCEIYSNVVIGHNGFGLYENPDKMKTVIKHFGGVTIGDNVTIYEGTHIARGTIDDTEIKDGAKIDALNHISHNCVIGKNVTMAMPCVLCGSVTIGDGSYISGATIMNQLNVGDHAFVGFGSVVLRNVKRESSVFGYPARLFNLGQGTEKD